MENQDKLVQPDLLKQNSENLPTGGPRFGLENKGGWGEKIRGWINKYGSSVVLPVIALLILAGGIYLYASQKSQSESIMTTKEEITVGLEGEITEQEKIINQPEEGFVEEIIPEGRRQEKTIIEKAIRGDGVTHLARRALKDYLKDNPYELTKEHKIYIEDYLKDKVGSSILEVDQEIAFSEDLIKEAIDASLQLTPEQLKNLEKYSALVVSW